MFRDLLRGDYGYHTAMMERHGLPIDTTRCNFSKITGRVSGRVV